MLIKMAINKKAGLSDMLIPAAKGLRTQVGAIAGTKLHDLPTKPGFLMNTAMALTGRKPRTLMHSAAVGLNNGFGKVENIMKRVPGPIKGLGRVGLDMVDALV